LKYKGVYDDVRITGTNMNRPRFNDMMAGIVKGEIKCVVVKDLSRLGRTYIEVGELLFDTFLQLGVRFISINDDYDSFAPDAGRKKLMILVKNLKNSQYSKDISQKIRSSIAVRQKKGIIIGSIPPYGYKFSEDKKSYLIVSEAAKTVNIVFNLYKNGMNITAICEYLNDNGYPTPSYHYYLLGLQKESSKTKRRVWTPIMLVTILRNEVYTGCLIQGKYENDDTGKIKRVPKEKWVIHTNTHQAIINKELFDDAQRINVYYQEKCTRIGTTHNDNIFVGKIFCSRCGRAVHRAMNINKQSRQRMYATYFCRTCLPELKRANNIKGKSMKLRSADLESLIYNDIKCQIESCLEMDTLLEKMAISEYIVNKKNTLAGKHNKLLKEAVRLTDLLTSAYTHHLSGLLDVIEHRFSC
jgi:DNA invertase Pin-like site-specific DNA recombinase